MRSGVANKTLQQELLQKCDTLNTLKDITQFCENFESAKNDSEKLCGNDPMISSLEKDDIVAAISNYRKLKKDGEPEKGSTNKPNKCYFCGYDYHQKQRCPPQGKTCNKCKDTNHFAQACHSVSVKEKGISSVVIGLVDRIINVSETKESGELPTLVVGVTNADNALPKPTEVVADTCRAQVTVTGLQHIKHFGLTLEELNEPPHGLQHAGGSPLKVLGSYLVSVMHNGQSADTEVYFAQGVKHMYLS